MSEKDIEYYLALPYKVVLHPAQEGGYVAEIPDLPGCLTQGETIEEAINMIQDAKICWLRSALEDGVEIPEPGQTLDEYSGRLNIRIPKSLHRTLAERARQERVSLNQYINYQLARASGFRS
ncbi:MAG TPA: type II toxin-antitoxin system HicB family antitoxin [Firmicutes bacterium]|jgi:antitoxin HicB|nr:type II toxin-antitoxin system HicB family antitoxin [Bacillota bacterium]